MIKDRNASQILTGVMLLIFVAVVAVGVISGAFSDLEHDSCTLSFAAAVLLLVLLYCLNRKYGLSGRIQETRPVLTGAVLALVCFLVNLVWILVFPLAPYCDYETFQNIASVLARVPLNEPAAFEPPLRIYVALFPHLFGYSLFLSIFMRLFGQSWLLAPMLNLVLTTCSGVMIYALCLRWLDQRSAIFAFVLWTVCPSKMLYNTMVLSEPLYTSILLLFLLYISFMDARCGSCKRPMLSGVLMGAGAGALLFLFNAIRPVAAIMLIAVFLWVLLLRPGALHGARGRRLWVSFLVAILIVYIPLGSLWDSFITNKIGEEPASVPAYNIFVGFNTDSEGSFSQDDMDVLFYYAYGEQLPAKAAQEKMLGNVKERLGSGSIDFAKLFLVKLGKFLGSDEGGAYYSSQNMTHSTQLIASALSNVFYYFTVGLVLCGIYRTRKQRALSSMLLAPLFILGLSLAQLFVEVAGRYHYSLIPLLIILASSALDAGRKIEAVKTVP